MSRKPTWQGDPSWAADTIRLVETEFKAETCQFEENLKPSIAPGFKPEDWSKDTAGSDTRPVETCWDQGKSIHGPQLDSLEQSPETMLHARPSSDLLAYPFLVQEVEVECRLGSFELAANRLAISLSHALDIQEELHTRVDASVQERLPIIWVTSSGHKAEVWCGAYINDKIVNFQGLLSASMRSPLM